MAFHLRGELSKVLFGADKRLRSAIRLIRRVYQRSDCVLRELIGAKPHFSANETEELILATRRYENLVRYWDLQQLGFSKKAAAQRLGINRETLRKWENRFHQGGVSALIARSRARRTPPPRTARTRELVAAIIAIRRHCTDGKVVLCETLRRQGFDVSASTIGRALAELRWRDSRFLAPLGLTFRLFSPKRKQRRVHAERCRERPSADTPGYAQMDTKQVVIAGVRLYVFGVRDVCTRAFYLMAASQATAASALRAFAYAQQQAGYRFHTIQTDNGSEFRGVFEDGLHQQGVAHKLIPVRSPKWNSLVENAFGYLSSSLFNVDDSIVPTVAGLQQALDPASARYNDKPNPALRHLCPDTGRTRLHTPNERYNLSLSSEKVRTLNLPSM